MGTTLDVDLETVGQLLSLMAHDLRNPLSALHSNLGFLSSELSSAMRDNWRTEPARAADLQDAIADGMISCDGLTHLIDNLDLLGQALRGSTIAPASSVSVREFVRDVMTRCERVADSHGLQIHFEEQDVDPALEVIVSRDPLARALSNLVRNSIQHSPAGSTVHVRVVPTESGVAIDVLDFGGRLPPERQEAAFTSRGQVGLKEGEWRYSRGLGLLAAGLAAKAAGARVEVAEPPAEFSNAFRLSVRQTSAE